MPENNGSYATVRVLVGWDLDNNLRVIEDDEWGADSHGFQWKGAPERRILKHPLMFHPNWKEKKPAEVIQIAARTRR